VSRSIFLVDRRASTFLETQSRRENAARPSRWHVAKHGISVAAFRHEVVKCILYSLFALKRALPLKVWRTGGARSCVILPLSHSSRAPIWRSFGRHGAPRRLL